MKKLIDKIEENVAAGYSKTYATIDAASSQIEKAEAKLDITINWFPVALQNGRVAVAIAGNRCQAKDVRNQGLIVSSLVHGTKGWMIFN